MKPPAKRLTEKNVELFRRTIYEYFRQNGRRLPWRETCDPYRILVSELMLQQTQVERVVGKYAHFTERFPDFRSLARAPLREILAAWQGLGYNRRAISLWRTAQRVVDEFEGLLPDSEQALLRFPGIGPATAGSVLAFAFHRPAVFIETNIRRVFIHFFFQEEHGVTDRQILPLVDLTLDRERVRVWYYALMDYGVMLRSVGPNPNRRSARYARQAPFSGSDRQIRGIVLKILVGTPFLAEERLIQLVGGEERRIQHIIAELVREGFLHRVDGKVGIVADS